jgi:hypothetical protein
MEISRIYGGGFLCDGVGLGKTYVDLMLIERLVVREGKRVVLLAPKSAMEDVWEPSIEKSLTHLNSGFVSLIKYNHTDLQRRDEKAGRDMELTLRDADVILIDEAHHFRNPGVAGMGATQESRYRRFQRFLHQEGARAKQFFS